MASLVNRLSNPIVNSELAKLRLASTTPKEFREGIERISLLVGYEASKDLATETFQGKTPVSGFQGEKIKPKIGLAPILRAGLGMTSPLLSLFPDARVSPRPLQGEGDSSAG